MKKFLLFTLFFSILFGCNPKDNTCGQAYFGGEIINPNSDFLVLYDKAEPIDTLYLDENNRFSFNIENLNYGLHSFRHGGESQIVIIEPHDSILLRLNTIDFDESLVFTGKGSKKNNYLLNLFLTLESEYKLMYKLSKLGPEEFEYKLDSLRKEKLNTLSDFTEKYPNSELFNKVSKASIDFNYYAHKELYPFRHYGNYELIDFNVLPHNFYAFRNTINYNDEDLVNFDSYYNFLFLHFNNLALQQYFKASRDNVFNRNSIDYNLNKLQLIDSLVSNNAIKNNLLKITTRNFLSYCNSSEDSETMFNSFMSKNTNEENSKYISSLNNTLKKLHPGNKFPEIEITNINNKVVNINTIINKPTIVYFWSKAVKNHFKNSHKKVIELKKSYPHVNFISINIDSQQSNIWQRMLSQNNFELNNEYKFRDPDAAKKILAIKYINKVMVVNSDKIIITSNANLFSNDFINLLNTLK
jgi:hypothetical protein